MVVEHGNEQGLMIQRISESRGHSAINTRGSAVRTGPEPTIKYKGMVWYDETTYTDPVYRLWDGSEWTNLSQKLSSRTTLLAVDTPVTI